jgi:hypothetical protein
MLYNKNILLLIIFVYLKNIIGFKVVQSQIRSYIEVIITVVSFINHVCCVYQAIDEYSVSDFSELFHKAPHKD